MLSSNVILNRVIFLSVIFNGLFFFFNSRNSGTTEPLLPKTLPYLTTENLIYFFPTILFADENSLSEQSLVAP